METEALNVPRERVSVTLPKDVLQWLDHQVEARTYYNRSHAIEKIVRKEMTQKGPQ